MNKNHHDVVPNLGRNIVFVFVFETIYGTINGGCCDDFRCDCAKLFVNGCAEESGGYEYPL